MKSITIFLLACQVILRFLPNGGYEKYARIIIGVMVLSRLALPLLSLGGFDAQAVFSDALSGYEQEMSRIEDEVEQAALKEGNYAQAGLLETLSERLSETCREKGIRLTSAAVTEDGILHLTVGKADSGTGADSGQKAEDERIGEIEVGQIRVGQTGGEDGGRTQAAPGEDASGKTVTDAEADETSAEELRRSFAQILDMKPENLEVIWDG